MNQNDLAKLIADLFNSCAAEPRPAGGEFDYLRFRFRNGSVQLSERPCSDADANRRGGYALYAVKTTIVPLNVPVGPMTYWAPSVFFIPDDEAMRPEVAYDGSPFRRGVEAVKFGRPS
ncbi:hypothetical protein [Tianweitania sediminis]|uniref:Uncharacterized protein n=1 Tax=Tianweitania sediminis TaxID=1502156 RepID=A0A8J7RSV9_9HYPH|nr:hypothetical protein [Tianweitania sediminis]MBP0441429.1 hypothetical protein [Tianweitania sediminis]